MKMPPTLCVARLHRPPKKTPTRWALCAFTLMELLTVITIIAVLMSLLFPAIRMVKESSKKALASGEVHRIATAVEAFHTEYGRYPLLPPAGRPGNDVAVGPRCIGMKIRNRELFYTLCSIDAGINSDFAVNPRKVVYFEGPNVSDAKNPKNGFLRGGSADGDERDCYFDPWGNEYCVAIDYSYDGTLKLAYMDYSGDHAPRVGVGAFSVGADQSLCLLYTSDA